MLGQDEEALQTDAYIDSLLAGHAGRQLGVRREDLGPDPAARSLIALLDQGLPRFHPSFLFEQALAARLRAAALGFNDEEGLLGGDVIRLPVHAAGMASSVVVDRRLLLGGAIASGVSLAGAAVLAWRRHERNRTGRRWLA
jgi:hypothetical protein